MAEEISVRPVETPEEALAAVELFDRVWGERRVISHALLWATAMHGGQVLAAYMGDEIVGAQLGVLGLAEGRLILHSHITGVLADVQHRGVGFLLKKAQRDWALERDIDRITWTFDPMVARNAYFNLVKLGAVAERFHRDYYGEMDDAFNRGERSDRLEVVWHLRSDRVAAALGEIGGAPRPENPVPAARVVRDEDGRPVASEVPEDAEPISISVPADYHGLRERDPGGAHAWRDVVGDMLERAFALGFHATGFVKEQDHAYLLERR